MSRDVGKTLCLALACLAAGCALPRPASPAPDGSDAPAPADGAFDQSVAPDASDVVSAPDAPDVVNLPDVLTVPDVPVVPDVMPSGCGPTEGNACLTAMTGACAMGVVRCVGSTPMCQGPSPQPETCDGVDNDCNGTVDNGFACAQHSAPVPCTTSCGSTGSSSCQASCARGACAPPAESCNFADDNCDSRCDEGCRVPVYQSYHMGSGAMASTDILYSLNAAESVPPYTSQGPAFTVYPMAMHMPGTVALYRCRSGNAHFPTLDSGCNGVHNYTVETQLGWVGTGPSCGAVVVYGAYCMTQQSAYLTRDATILARLVTDGCTSYGPSFWAWAD